MTTLPALLMALALLPQDAVSTAPAQAPVDPAPAAVQAEGPVPRGAPADDYGLVNWCSGALSGHMALYPQVRDQLPAEGYAADEEMMAAGREYLDLYGRAIAAADATATSSRLQAAQTARNQGANVWTPAAGLTPTDLKWAYLGWSLPGRCETAARRLLSNAELAAPALRGAPAQASAALPAEPAPAEPTVADPAPTTPEPAPGT